MLTAKKIWYRGDGAKDISDINVPDADTALRMAKNVFQKKAEACCLTFDVFDNGAFVTRVMSEQRMIFKIEYTNN